jgi:transcriptional regulator of acetoin/glycerol metabolism
MPDLPPEIAAQRAIEDRAIELAAERRRLLGGLEETVGEALELLGEAEAAGVPAERLATLLGVDRTTLYRWRTAQTHGAS